MEFERRRAGVLLHPTSLPGPGAAGDLGDPAHRFVDWLASAGQRVWQMLPVGPTDGEHSPYSSPSTFAGHPGLIARDGLVRDGLLEASATALQPGTPGRARLDHERGRRRIMLHDAWEQFRRACPETLRVDFESFVESPDRAGWLDDWVLFAALRERLGGRPWTDWPDSLRTRQPAALRAAFDELAERVEYERFVQFVFDRQWRALAEHASSRGVTLFGDMPLYVAHDSADVWAHPDCFALDEHGRPARVAGVPPDYFSETGQLWGNPVYDWARLAATGYRWWRERVRAALDRTPLVRLDHFRAFAAYWEVPAGATTALDGRWIEGPGRSLFDTLELDFGTPLPFVAEDLGQIDDDVRALRDAYGLAGMRIVQFGLLDDGSEHDPAGYPHDVVAYTGTHDNAPIRGWLDALPPTERRRALDRLGVAEHHAARRAVELAWQSGARLAIAPVQDLLGLGEEGRMNRPGSASGNWDWRADPAAFDDGLAERLAKLSAATDRA